MYYTVDKCSSFICNMNLPQSTTVNLLSCPQVSARETNVEYQYSVILFLFLFLGVRYTTALSRGRGRGWTGWCRGGGGGGGWDSMLDSWKISLKTKARCPYTKPTVQTASIQ